MKKLLLLLMLIPTYKCFAQEKFSKEVQDISDNIIKQITGSSAKAKLGKDTIAYKVAIVSIENEDKKKTKLTELLENKIAINLAMESNGKYDVLDRNYIEELMKEKNIPLQYDNKRDFARNLGRIKAANFIVVGMLSNFENDFELNLQIIETTEGNTIGGATGTITATQLLKGKNGQVSNSNANTSNNYSQENPQPQTAAIEKTKVRTSNNNPCDNGKGDICIKNTGRVTLEVYIRKTSSQNRNSSQKITLNENAQGCFYDLNEGIYTIDYQTLDSDVWNQGRSGRQQVRVIACQTNPKPIEISIEVYR
jgi:hypothetical protein